MLFAIAFILPLVHCQTTAVCPETATVECGENDTVCPGFPMPNGCMSPGTCMPLPTAANPCPPICPPPPCGEVETFCDMGVDVNGCWMGGHCLMGTAVDPGMAYISHYTFIGFYQITVVNTFSTSVCAIFGAYQIF